MNYEIRQAQAIDLKSVTDLDDEAFSPYGTAENPEIFRLRMKMFPAGFVILTEGEEIAGYGCAEKWLTEREPSLDENPLATHRSEGTIFCITGMAIRIKQRGKGYGLAILDHLIQIAQKEHCTKIVLETTHAQGFYLKRDFKTVDSRLQRGLTLDIMLLEVSPSAGKN